MRTATTPPAGRDLRAAVLLVLPCLALLAVFSYWPVLRSAWLSMHGSDLVGNATGFLGLANYADLLTDPDLRSVVLTTLTIAALVVVLSTGGALLAALPLRRASRRGGRVVTVLLSLPFAYSAAAASAAFAGLLAPSVGQLNAVLADLGVSGPPWLEPRAGLCSASR